MAITNDTALDPSIDRRLAVDIDAAEGDRLTAYQDTLGNWTCGRGHLMPQPAPGRSWEGFTVVQATSDSWFVTDILSAIRVAQRWPELSKCDTGCRRNALYEIAFNMGGRWDTFVHARAAIESQDWQKTHDELLNSEWAKQVHGRATRIANYFLTGVYPDGT
jgi:GH24 family phage-related lysozyme (muramidase)